jgi:transcriptional regulator with XRE-family HTH domain
MDNYRLKIKEFRQIKKLTQKQLAERTGISRSYLSELENQKYSIKLPLLLKISTVLEIDPWILLEAKLKGGNTH